MKKAFLYLFGVCSSVAIDNSASAGYIQSLGNDEDCVAIGGACTAVEGSLGSYSTNPASLIDFTRPRLGFDGRILDTLNLDLADSAGNHPISRTNTRSDYALAPTIAGYWPISNRLVLGLGIGAPYAITADWGGAAGIHRYDMSDQALFLLDIAPSVGFKVDDRLSIGASLSVTAFKHLRTQTLIPNSFGAALPPALGGAGKIIPTTPYSPIIGSITLNTDHDFHIGLPPDNLQTAFDEYAFILGARYKLSDTLTVGISGRTQTDTTFKGQTTLAVGALTQTVPFKLRLDMPAHVQAGLAVQATPDLIVSLDYQRTFWSDATGLGTPAVIEFGAPLLGFIKKLRVDYAAHDTSTIRIGAQYRLTPQITVLGGYAFDESVFPTSNVDILTYDSNRYIFSTGVRYDTRADPNSSGWILTGSFQWIQYEHRDIATGQSRNLGGVSLPVLVDGETLGFGPNRGPFAMGGSIRAISFGVEYQF